MSNTDADRITVEIEIPAGRIAIPAEVPHALIPITALVGPAQRLGEEAHRLEVQRTLSNGAALSCREGCAACCRMLVPVSVPEALALREAIAGWPEERRARVAQRLDEARKRLEQAGLLPTLRALADAPSQVTDEEAEPVNRAYYALRLPCPFLEEERCSIYEHRPAACRELLVTSPADLCQDIERNPVRPIEPPLRLSTVLALLWSHLAGGPARFIPLPLALEWLDRHAEDGRQTWLATNLFKQLLDHFGLVLSRELAGRQRGHRPEPSSTLRQPPTSSQ